jgi:hypothetical protein
VSVFLTEARVILHGIEPLLLQVRNVAPGERLEGEVDKRGAAPEAQGGPQQLAAWSNRPSPNARRPATDRALELLEIEFVGPEAQAVAGGRRLDHVPLPSVFSRVTCTSTILTESAPASSAPHRVRERSALTGRVAFRRRTAMHEARAWRHPRSAGYAARVPMRNSSVDRDHNSF